MVIESFRVNGFQLVDTQDLSERQSNEVTAAISFGLQLFPLEYQCEAIKRDPNGEFPIVRLGVFDNRDLLIGGLWFGCNLLEESSTKLDVRIFTRPSIGPILRHESKFWKGPIMTLLVNYFLRNQLEIREGGTLQIVGFDYIADSRVETTGLAKIHGEFDTGLKNDGGLDRDEKPLDAGGFEVRITKKSNGRP